MSYDFKEVGDVLKKQRLKLNRELREISEEIKISYEYLAALENGEPGELPSLVYYNLFVRSYAAELGLDPEEILEELSYPERAANSERTADSGRRARGEDDASGKAARSGKKLALWIGAVIVVVVAAVFVISFTLGDRSQTGLSGELAGSASDSAAGSGGAAADTADTSQKIVPPMRLDIRISQLSWVLVIADGDTVLNRNLEQDATRSLRAAESFVISVGNPGGVELKLDDAPLRPLSSSGRPVRDLEINRTNVKDFYLIPQVGIIEKN